MPSNTPLVSVAMATYNGERFLREQLDSIYNQTYTNIEVVVTDDCSNDKTVKILDEYRIKHNLKYFVNEKNLGLVKNFEKSISLCKGDFIALSDQDDIWLPNKIETLVNEIGNYTLIYSNSYITDENSTLINKPYKPYYYTDDSKARFRETGKPTHKLIACNWVISHAILFKQELLPWALPIPDGFYFHDAWLAIVASKLNGIKFLNKCLMYYRFHSDSLTHQFNNMPRNNIINIFLPNSQHNQIKRKIYQERITVLINISRFRLFDRIDNCFIEELMTYYENRLSSIIHLKSFAIAIKYSNYFCWGGNVFHRLKFMLASLIN